MQHFSAVGEIVIFDRIQFLEENTGNTFYHATTNDQVEIIYCPAKEKGIWFLPRGGAGPLQAKGLKIMKEIVGKR
jgi:hypothetical protein